MQVSIPILIVTNCIPLLGVLFWGWDLFDAVLLYWSESAVIGFFHILKMYKVGKFRKVSFLITTTSVVRLGFHYGWFMFGHLIFLYSIFRPELTVGTLLPPLHIILSSYATVAFAVAIMFVSHGISYVQNFIGKSEFERMDPKKFDSKLYNRIFLMHITIVIGGFLTLIFNAPVLTLVLLIILKTVADLYSHIREHQSA
jgi:hypothetical protein